jgi:nucleoid-associated protein YgaU
MPSTPITIEQVDGPRKMVFHGRSLPYRGFELTRTMGHTTTWNPGNPVATQQVLGPRFEPTEFEGTWKDRYLRTDGVVLIGFPRISPAAIPQSSIAGGSSFVGTGAFPALQRARLARTVDDAFELLFSEGLKIRWSWETKVRYGLITRYTSRPGTPTGGLSDIGWTMEMTWSGNVEAPPISRAVTYNVLATASGLQTLLAELLAELGKVTAIKQPNAFLANVATEIDSILSVVAALVEAFRKITNFLTAPSDLLATIQGSLQTIRSQVQAFFARLEQIGSAYGEAARVGRTEDVQIAALIQNSLRKRLQELAAFAATQQRLALLFTADDLIATYFAKSFTTLRDVAAEYYGDQALWTKISDYNGIFSATVPAGTLVRIPRI